MMEGHDRTHPANKLAKPPWEPEHPEDLEKKARWNLTYEPGVVVARYHVCQGDVNPKTTVPWYFGDPREIWEEVESCGLRVIRVQCEQGFEARWPSFTLVAVRD